MLLSVVVYNHKLTAGQWTGAGIVFAGISVEALVKRTGEMTPQPKLRLFPQQKLTIPSRGSLEACCAGEGKSKDQGIMTCPRVLCRPTVLWFLSLYLSLFIHSNRNISSTWTLSRPVAARVMATITGRVVVHFGR